MVKLKELLKLGKVENFSKNQIVVKQYDKVDSIYVALKGTFGVYINSYTDFPMRVASIGVGNCFGEMSVIDEGTRSATIISEDECSALLIEKEHFEDFIKINPQMAFAIVKTMSKRAKTTIEMVRQAGMETPDLPDYLMNPKQVDSASEKRMMLELTQKIRELNMMLGIEETIKIRIKPLSSVGFPLLPPEHKRFLQFDSFDNSMILARRALACPYCLTKFEGRIPLFSCLEEKERTLDQRIIYVNFNYLYYLNIVCPNCNYCDVYHEFQKSESIEPPRMTGNQFVNNEGFTGFQFELQHTLDEAILSYYLHLNCLELVQDPSFRQAKAWHCLYWLYSDNGETELTIMAARNAIQYYKYHSEFNRIRIKTVDQLTINVIMAELSLALDEKEAAKGYYFENIKLGRISAHELVAKSTRRFEELNYKP